ncbi:unnamed protein product [Sphagnum troendelagicum]
MTTKESEAEELVKSEGKKRKWAREDNMMASSNGGGIQRYFITLEYVGTRFLGFQKQKGMRTVQGVLEAAFEMFVGHPVVSAASSRTDTGVHATANVCHVDVVRYSKRKPGEVMPPHEPETVKKAVNHFLQKEGDDVAIVNVRRVPLDFHARFQAKERTYHYRILAGTGLLSVFEKDRAWHVPEELDLADMQEACRVLIGHHDFSSFRAAGCQALSPLKTLDELNVCETPTWPCFPTQEQRRSFTPASESCKDKGESLSGSEDMDVNADAKRKLRCFVVTARARSFLYHQVRLLVGLLKAVGSKALTTKDVQRILDARTITATPAMAPACGLYLVDVKYDFTCSNSKERHTDVADDGLDEFSN